MVKSSGGFSVFTGLDCSLADALAAVQSSQTLHATLLTSITTSSSAGREAEHTAFLFGGYGSRK